MVKDSDEEYRDTMQEIMLELKLSTSTFLKKVKEKNIKTEDSLEIPITISLRENYQEFERDLFGVGEKIQTNMMLSYPNPKLDNIRLVNQNVLITKGATLQHGKNKFFSKDSEKVGYTNHNYILFISNVLDIGANVNTVADWFFEKILKKDCQLAIKGKEITNRNELQEILNDILLN